LRRWEGGCTCAISGQGSPGLVSKWTTNLFCMASQCILV